MTYFDKKVALLKRMDKAIRNFNDEEYIEPWLMCGVPDGATEEDYECIAEDADDFLDVISLFAKITIKAMEEEEIIIEG